jgi:hypothetical protein
MSLTKHEIELSYRLFLGRQPSAQETEQMLANQTSLDSLRRVFLNSQEFRSAHREQKSEKSASSGRTIIHLHIPKTAGSSLSRLLVSDTQPNERITIGDNSRDQLTSLPPARLSQLKLIFGHLTHGIAETLPQRCHYVSVLRQPGPRILSFYRYVSRTDHHPLHEKLTRQNMSFGDFLEFTAANPQFRMEVDNGQIRRLGGNMEVSGLGHERALLRHALHNVFAPNFTFGLTDHFDGFQKRLVKQRLLSATTSIRENAAPMPGQLDAELDALSRKQRGIYNGYVAWDDQLYKICKSIYFANKMIKEALS